jgi:feruloyl esterase
MRHSEEAKMVRHASRAFAFQLASSLGLLAAGAAAPATAPHAECSHLPMLQLPDVEITAATAVLTAITGELRAAHCRVEGTIGTEIRFRLLLPEEWNHRFLMGGCGGFCGAVQNQAEICLNDGFATVGTDAGHSGAQVDASWAQDNLERRLDYGYLAVHRTAVVAKAIISGYYGARSEKSYFIGCSNGGRQALMEAQRFPDDFDGVVAGAPALDFVGIAAQFVKDAQAVFPDAKVKTPMFTPMTLRSIEAQILEKCDATDGVRDGLIEDPRMCAVNVAEIAGLTAAQRGALKRVYAATGANGSIYPDQPPGGEGADGGWAMWITGAGQAMPQGPSLRYAFGTQFFKYLVFNDPSWDYLAYDVSRARTDAALTQTFMNADAYLDAFKAKGHKAILWHGWSDPAISALASIDYYERVRAHDAAADRTSTSGEYFRLFLLPGVLHCGDGPGPDVADWHSAIVDWVEKGTAPGRTVARKLNGDGSVARTRPLCPYPQRAVYSGSGSIDDEKNFACR